jgi:hypothetical protein
MRFGRELKLLYLPSPLLPTRAGPGSEEKIKVMCVRAAGGFGIFHADDAVGPVRWKPEVFEPVLGGAWKPRKKPQGQRNS